MQGYVVSLQPAQTGFAALALSRGFIRQALPHQENDPV